ncbi:MAG: type II and III secretion system protein family protein [Alphaproteobacteria bacterium]|jgi:pilus assembly protein CpaC|nr:type II and III secretion system protein family protein [Alphaproteobacteria bacterium]
MIARPRLKSALLGLALCAMPPAAAQNMIGVSITEPGDSAVSRSVTLGLNKSTVVDLPRAAADVVITSSEIADAVVQTRKRIIFRGVALGQTNAFIYDDEGKEILNLELTVENDLSGLNDLLARHLPDSRVTVEAVNGSVVVTGAVDNVSDSERVMQFVSLYTDEGAEPVNMLTVAAKDQVLLEVRVVEMQRSFLKQLGLSPELSLDVSNTSGDPLDLNLGYDAANVSGGASGSLSFLDIDEGFTEFRADLDVDALERVGIARTLAEPNITAVSGEAANFLAGGEFPVPTPPDQNGRVGIEFKQFGVGLGFTPVVLSENRISLKVSTEVSELSAQGAAGDVPALSVRRVDSTVELPSGQSMMLAGLIQSRSRQELDKVPGIKHVPVIGSLFQSRDFTSDESELVVIITPYLVDPTAKRKLRTPADGFANASDIQTVLFGKLNRLYGKGEYSLGPENYRAPVGFIEE